VTVRKLINNKYMHKYITKMYLGTRGENIDGKERGIERRREGAGREGERERERRERERLTSGCKSGFFHQSLPPGGTVTEQLPAASASPGRQPEQSEAADLPAFKAK
jgi:hypothetical protein